MTEEEKLERQARSLWNKRPLRSDISTITSRYNFSPAEINALDWTTIPEEIREEIRDIARKEVQA